MNNAILVALRFRNRYLLLKALMWACFIVEGDVFDQHATQMALIEDQNAIETLLAWGPNPVG
jgi:hypothetical protein